MLLGKKLFPALACAALLANQAFAGDFEIAESRKSVVYIRSMVPGYSIRSGSGFVVSKDGLIYTNRHVVMPEVFASDVTSKPAATGPAARLTDGDGEPAPDAKATPKLSPIVVVGVQSAKDSETLEFFRAQVVYVSPEKDPLDFAILKIAAKPEHAPFRPLPLNFGKGELGASVAAMGFPAVQEDSPSLSFTKGTISTAARKINNVTYCQTDAAVNPGNSGGPLLNTAGEAIAIVTAKKVDAENIGFALYLSQTMEVSTLAGTPPGAPPEAGPIAQNVPLMDGIAATAGQWTVGLGTLMEHKPLIVVQNSEKPRWVSSKRTLPAAFQLNILAGLVPNSGTGTAASAASEHIRVRFASDETRPILPEHTGYEILWSHTSIQLYRAGTKTICYRQPIPMPKTPVMLNVVYKDGVIIASCDDVPILAYRDAEPFTAAAQVCIGSGDADLLCGKIDVVDLTDAPAVPLPIVLVPKAMTKPRTTQTTTGQRATITRNPAPRPTPAPAAPPAGDSTAQRPRSQLPSNVPRPGQIALPEISDSSR